MAAAALDTTAGRPPRPAELSPNAGARSVAASVPPAGPRWLSNRSPTSLWAAPARDAPAFTDLPAGSFLRVEGPRESGRWPVYYVGDGLLRRPGRAWVDASAVQEVEAPPPGQVPQVDASADQQLPAWLQAHTATRLWSGPDDQAVGLTDLPQWSYLRVAGLSRGGRLLVEYAGDYLARQPGIGWVDEGSVGPAGEPGVWVQNYRPSSLWSGTDERAQRFTDLPQWSKLRLVEGAANNPDRLLVEYYGDGRSRQPGTAWVPRADVGPMTPPTPLPGRLKMVPSSVLAGGSQSAAEVQAQGQAVGRQPQSYSFASQDDFINTVGAAARRSRQATGVPASVTVAQAILESDWGRSRLTRQGNNLFGIKALTAPGPAGVISLSTWEYLDGNDVVVQAPFRAYFSLEESVEDHGRFFRGRTYRQAMAVADDPRAFARAIQDAGYATDPEYASKLIRLMDRYDLYRFDG